MQKHLGHKKVQGQSEGALQNRHVHGTKNLISAA